MLKKEFIYIRPQHDKSFRDSIDCCIKTIDRTLKEKNIGKEILLKQCVFLAADSEDDFYARKKQLLTALENYYESVMPPTSVLGQPPASGEVLVVELILPAAPRHDLTLARKEIDGIPYMTVQYPGFKEVYAAGLTAGNTCNGPLEQSRAAFELVKKILDKEDLQFSDIVRQWNYIQDITGETVLPDGKKQVYQVFNDIRSIYYGTADFKNGFPAATGIGQQNGGIVLDFIAAGPSNGNGSDLSIVPIKNPAQANAHEYGQTVLVGEPLKEVKHKTTPKFERAKLLQRTNEYILYVSGTASITGQKTVAVGDPGEQTRVTIDNIEKLIAKGNLVKCGADVTGDPHFLAGCRVYIKYPRDVTAIEKICGQYYKDVPVVYLISDICRDALLVEIEGEVHG